MKPSVTVAVDKVVLASPDGLTRGSFTMSYLEAVELAAELRAAAGLRADNPGDVE